MNRQSILIWPVLTGLVVMTVAAQPCAAAAAADYDDFSELDLEALLNQTIVTAAKHTQKLSDTPVAATVITAEEIAASGARSIPELLRTVPGLDVLQATSSSFDVSARGLNKLGSNTMLVLVDGRSVYLDFYGLVMWDKLSVGLEDIKVIEVIKGPGSSMHGANAFAGVINIITYTATEKTGNSARVMTSNLRESYGSLRHAARRGGLSWKLTGGWDQTSNWQEERIESRSNRIEGQARVDLADDSWISVGGGRTEGCSRAFVPELLHYDGSNDYARADFVRGTLALRWYTNHNTAVVDPVDLDLTGGPADIENRMHDIELQHSLRFGRAHHLVWGGSYRHSRSFFSQTDGTAKEDVYAGFILEEWTPRHDLRISAGLRYEHHPLVGGNVSPRGGVVFKPAPRHHMRLSYGKAYRNPSYIETHWWIEYELIPGLRQIMRGDMGNRSEEIEAVELGYQGLVRDDLLVTASLFQNRMDDLITTHTVSFYPPPLHQIPREMAFVNALSWRSRGGEFSFRADPAAWLVLSGQYSCVWLEDVETGAHIARAPVHAASLAARMRPSAGHYLQLTGRFRSGSRWGRSFADPIGSDVSEERLVLDATWNMTTGDGHRATAAVENLFDRRYRDHPQAIEHRRRLIISVTVHF